MRILVLNPSSRVAKNVVRDVLYGCWCKGKRIGGGTVPPFALLQVATVLKEAGFKVDFLDAAAQQIPFEEVRSKINSYQVVVISTSTMSFQEDASFLQGLKEANSSLVTIVFGSHPTFMPEYCLEKKSIDIIVRREPEYIVRDIISNMAAGKPWKQVLGIGFAENGQKVINDYYLLDNDRL